MWIKRSCTLLLAAFLLSLPAVSYCTDTMNKQDNATVTMQYSQYNRLKEIMNEQSMQITKLEGIISLLKQNSTEDKETLLTLQTQLNDCRTRLTIAQDLLTKQGEKLTEVNSLLMSNEESLKTLTKQIKVMERTISRLERQRDVWMVIAGAFAIYNVCN